MEARGYASVRVAPCEIGAAIGLALALALAPPRAVAQVPADPTNYARTSSFTYYSAADGSKNGLLKSETIEPGNLQLCAVTVYDYDANGNHKSASTANCAGATGIALFGVRTSTSTFGAVAAQPITVGGASVNVAVPIGLFPGSSTNALSQSESKTFDPRFGSVLTLTGPNGLTTRWSVDDFGRKVRELRADNTSTVIAYCVLAASGLDTGSNSNTASGDPMNCPVPAAGEAPPGSVSFVHSEPRDTSGAKMGAFVRVYSDRLGRQIRSVTEGFDGAGQAAGRSAALVVQDTVYNATGAKIIQTQPYFLASGSSTVAGNNDLGASCTDYDALGRPVAVYTADPDGSQASGAVSFGGAAGGGYGNYGSPTASKQTVSYTGLDTLTTNDKGQTRKEEKNPNGETVRITDATGAQVAYQRDAFGNLLTTKDALQNQIVVSYDVRGRKTQMNDPDTGLWAYQYDALGQLVWQQNPNQRAAGTATTMAYDALGRMTSRVEPEFTSTWSYDKYVADAAGTSSCNKGIGKLCESVTSNGVDKKIVYDGLGRPASTRTTVNNGPSFASAVTYDATTGRLATQTYPTGVQVGFGYTSGSARGFLEKLTLLTPATVAPLPASPGGPIGSGTTLLSGTLLWQAQYVDAWGKPEQQVYGNGVITTATLEAATGRTTSLKAGSLNTVLNQQYVWDSLNNLSARVDGNADGAPPPTGAAVSETFTYGDGLNRLTSYTVSSPPIAGYARTVNLQYNSLGMLLYKSDVGDYSYGAQGANAVRPHALQGVVGAVNASYVYDANGNITSSSGGKYSSIAYTSFNLPDSQSGIAGSGNGGTRYTWQYDESHARIKEVRTIASGTFAGTRTTWNLHPDNQGGLGFESEVNAPTSANAQNVGATSNRHYLSAAGQVIGVLVTSGALPALAAAQTTPPSHASVTIVKLEYWHKDQLGSLITTTDHQGAVTQRYAYDPFGKRRFTNGNYDSAGSVVVDWSAGVNYGTERGFTGHQELDEVGLVHMNGRVFDPTLGVFLQGDPLIQDQLNLQNYNRYGYCYNNPMTCSDPSGLSFLSWADPIGNALRPGGPVDSASAKLLFSTIRSLPGQRAIDNYFLTHEWAYTVGIAAAGYWGGPVAVAAIQGYATYARGGSIGDAQKSARISYGTSVAFDLVGTYLPADGTASGAAWNVAGHAAVGCVSAEASGGSCGAGAASAGVSAAWTNSGWSSSNAVIGLVQNAAIGGLSSLAAGGTFDSGARTAAYGYLFNFLVHVWRPAIVNGVPQIGHVMVTTDDGQVVESQFPDTHSPRGVNTTLTAQATNDAEGRAPDSIYYVANGPNAAAGLAAGEQEQSKRTWQVLAVTSDETNCSVAAGHVLSAVNPAYSWISMPTIPSPWSVDTMLNTLSNWQKSGLYSAGVYKIK